MAVTCVKYAPSPHGRSELTVTIRSSDCVEGGASEDAVPYTEPFNFHVCCVQLRAFYHIALLEDRVPSLVSALSDRYIYWHTWYKKYLSMRVIDKADLYTDRYTVREWKRYVSSRRKNSYI